MTDNHENMELDELRRELSVLKTRLSEQVRVNEEHIMKEAKGRMSKIRVQSISLLVLCVFALLFCPYVFVRVLDMSVPFIVVTAVFLAVCLVVNIVNYIHLQKVDLSSNLVDAGRRISKFKLSTKRWQTIGLCFIAPWFLWFVAEDLMKSGRDFSYAVGIVIGAVIGGVIGLILGLRTNKSFISSSNELLKQIDELQKDC